MQMRFTIEPEKMGKSYVVYRLLDAAGIVQFVGHCRMVQFGALPDARANALFMAIFPPGQPLTVEVLHIVADRRMAQNRLWEYMQQNGRPFMLIHGLRPGMKGTPVICNETGERFNTLTECANAHGLQQGALSSHLAMKPGYVTLRGKTYTRSTGTLRAAQAQGPVIPAVPLHAPAPVAGVRDTTGTPPIDIKFNAVPLHAPARSYNEVIQDMQKDK